ncbi:hypothetical protein HMN09_00369800 [Mycena chlorophos]|uniref:F-box domain-containing protein n=1 Tax=Mycena chlorophos TaxID=658473 RepID=A0A8H6TJT4_MYCCL|nr:hypothetical protein HMN09_00369800 [Mycena chlorophos]
MRTRTPSLSRSQDSMEPSPTLKLPTETIAEIFHHYLPPYPLCPPFLGDSSPTRLTHVCRRWRDIALSSRALWRAIRIDGKETQPDDVPSRQLSFTETWFARSEPLAVSVSYRCHFHAYYATAPKWQHQTAILAALFAQCHRWQYATLELSENVPIVPSRASPTRHMPLLVDLRLKTYSMGTEVALAKLDTPRLRRLEGILQSHDNYMVLFGPSVLGGLTHLTLHFIAVTDAWSLLKHCPLLTHCRLLVTNAVFLGSEFEETHVRVPLSNLTTLVLDFAGGVVPNIDVLLSAVALPALQNLAINESLANFGLSQAFADDPHCAKTLAAAVDRWDCHLQTLSVLRCDFRKREKVLEEYSRAFGGVGQIELLDKDDDEILRGRWFA